ncbi:maltose regulon periplasmic protein [Citrobacter koseri]|nr:maltose regulon periplasmic protein [Citrobacter koseri]
MKMKKSLVALCLSAGLLASAPGISLADVNYVPQNTSAAPAIPTTALQQLHLDACRPVQYAVHTAFYRWSAA